MAILSPAMSSLVDEKAQDQHIVQMNDNANEMAPPPHYEGGSSPCRFRGGRRGAGPCRRRCANLSFKQRFALRFVTYFALANLYVNRALIASLFPSAYHVIVSYTPTWISATWVTIKDVANIPFGISTLVGLLFYSALASLVITSLRARIMHKRHLRFQEWIKNGGGRQHRHHRFPRHIHRHEELEKGQQYKDDVNSGKETPASGI